MTDQTMLERCARAIAIGLGDDFDHAHDHKSHWNATRGEGGGRYRDINEPFKPDYLDAARAMLEAMREPTEAMLVRGHEQIELFTDIVSSYEGDVRVIEPEASCEVYQAMIDAILTEGDA